MSCISLGKYKKKIFFPILSSLLLFIIFLFEYYSGYFFDFKRINTPNLYSLYFSFSFLGSCIIGGTCLYILKKNIRGNNARLITKKRNNTINKEDNNPKKEDENNKNNIAIPLLYNKERTRINISIKYLIVSSLLELLANFSYCSIVFDFMDIESKIIYGGFEIIFIKLISKYIFKNHLYKHQIISMVLLLMILFIAIMFRENFLMKIVKKKIKVYKSDFEKYLIESSNEKLKSGIIYYYYFIFIILGLIIKSLSVCYDKWLITDRLCDQYKLLYFKGFFGFIPSIIIQLGLYFTLGEGENIREEAINIKNLYKRLSFPVSSFILNKNINICLIILFFIIVTFYVMTFIITINKFNSEFGGFVSIFSSSLSIIAIQIINYVIKGEKNNKSIAIICSMHILFFILLLIPSLIICEIIILRFCGCDENTYKKKEKRANSEVKSSLKLYEEEDEESKTRSDEQSLSRSQEDSNT